MFPTLNSFGRGVNYTMYYALLLQNMKGFHEVWRGRILKEGQGEKWMKG